MLFSSAHLRITNTKCWDRAEEQDDFPGKPVCFRFFSESVSTSIAGCGGLAMKVRHLRHLWEVWSCNTSFQKKGDVSVECIVGERSYYVIHFVQLVCSLQVAYVYALGQILPMGEILNTSFLFLCDSPLNIWSCVLYFQVKSTPSSFILPLFNTYLIEFFNCFIESSF